MLRQRPATAASFRTEDNQHVVIDDSSSQGLPGHMTSGSTTFDPRDAVRLYRHDEHYPGYTGHVPRLGQTHGKCFTAGTRLALLAPPAPEKNQRPQSQYEGRRARRVLTAPYWLPGSTFSGYAAPTGERGKGGPQASVNGTHKYLQGSAVDVSAYYTSLAAQNYKQLLIKSGSPAKARSHIDLGDRFYFNGPHMWQTTQNESYPKYFDGKENMQHDQLRPGTGERPNSPGQRLEAMVLSENNKKLEIGGNDPKERAYHYKVLGAIVGAKRLDVLDRQVRSKLSQLSGSGGRELFKVFDRDGSGHIRPDNFHEICQSLGIHMSATEAGGLYGRYDANLDGEITFYEFLDHLGSQKNNHSNYY